MTRKTQTAVLHGIEQAARGHTVWFVYASGRRRIAKEIEFQCRRLGFRIERAGDEFRFHFNGGRIVLCSTQEAPKPKYLPDASHTIIRDHRAETTL